MAPPPPPRRGYQDVPSPSSGREGSQQRAYYGGNNAYEETNNGDGSWSTNQDVSDAGQGPTSEGQRDDRYGYYERRRGHVGRERRGGEEDRNSSYYGNNEFSGHRSSREYDTHNAYYVSQADDNRHASSQSDWKCLECRTWNYPDEGRCHRCGTHVDDMYPPHHHPDDRNRSSYHGNSEQQGEATRRGREDEKNSQDKGSESDALDEFGRAKKKTKTSSKKEWPPCFDTHGAEYVLDTRSGGMFYHSETNFFYDPQTKLYYGNRDATYYRYDPDHNKKAKNDDSEDAKKKPSSPFVAVQKVKTGPAAAAGSPSSHHDAHTPDPVLCGNSSIAKTSGKPSISITLKTKKLPKKGSSSKAKTEAPTPVVPTVQRRQHDADISKWSERQEEMKQQQDTPKEASDSKTIARTAKGEPICTLCQRKFPSVEKLRYHERVSKLHAENLAKQQQQQEKDDEGEGDPAKRTKEEGNPESPQKNSASETSSSSYVDRAQQRCQMYGQDATTEASVVASASVTTPPSPPPTDTATPDVVRPDQTLGSHNVGNQMLQKLGWKSGQSLGRRSEGGDSDNNNDGNNNNNTNKALQKDWERIEALAAQRK